MNAIYSKIPVQNQEARDIIISVIEGKMAFDDGFLRLQPLWFPVEGIKRSRTPVISTRQDSIMGLNDITFSLMEIGKNEEARRLAELNLLLAEKADDHGTLVVCASTLVQLLAGDISASRRRLELAEFAIPELKKMNLPEGMIGVLLFHLADARYTESLSNSSLLMPTIEAGEEALGYRSKMHKYFSARLNSVLGSVYRKLPATEKNLNQSITYLRDALADFQSARMTDDSIYGAVLNNLGNSYRDLGSLTANQKLLRMSLEYYKHCMDRAKTPEDRRLAMENSEQASSMLRHLEGEHTSEPNNLFSRLFGGKKKSEPSPEIKRKVSSSTDEPRDDFVSLMRWGEELFYKAQKTTRPEDKENHFRESVQTFMTAMKKFGGQLSDSDRAEILHRLGVPFLLGDTDEEMWTAFCFAHAARRMAGDGWSERNLARLDFHQGKALTFIGYPYHLEYLMPARDHLEKSMQGMSSSQNEGEYQGVLAQYKLVMKLINDLED